MKNRALSFLLIFAALTIYIALYYDVHFTSPDGIADNTSTAPVEIKKKHSEIGHPQEGNEIDNLQLSNASDSTSGSLLDDPVIRSFASPARITLEDYFGRKKFNEFQQTFIAMRFLREQISKADIEKIFTILQQNGTDSPQNVELLGMIEEIGSPAGLETLKVIVGDDGFNSQDMVFLEALTALARAGGKEELNVIFTKMNSFDRKSNEVEGMKSVLLREWTNTSAEQYVISIASDPSASLIARQAATEILGNLDDPAALQFLETLVSSDVSEVSRAAVYAIKRINDRRYVSGVAPK